MSNSPLLGLYPDYPKPPKDVLHDSKPLETLSLLKYMNEKYTYPQRTTDLTVVETSKQTGIKTYIFICPILYGVGTGAFHKFTHQVPELMRAASKDGHSWIIGEGEGIKNHIHIEDLAALFETYLAAILEGKDVPYGEKGIFFAENGEHSWKEVGDGIAKAGVELGILKSPEVKSLSLEEANKKVDWENEIWMESGFVSR